MIKLSEPQLLCLMNRNTNTYFTGTWRRNSYAKYRRSYWCFCHFSHDRTSLLPIWPLRPGWTLDTKARKESTDDLRKGQLLSPRRLTQNFPDDSGPAASPLCMKNLLPLLSSPELNWYCIRSHIWTLFRPATCWNNSSNKKLTANYSDLMIQMILIRVWLLETCGSSFSLHSMNTDEPRRSLGVPFLREYSGGRNWDLLKKADFSAWTEALWKFWRETNHR
jgi:hypothetical protein